MDNITPPLPLSPQLAWLDERGLSDIRPGKNSRAFRTHDADYWTEALSINEYIVLKRDSCPLLTIVDRGEPTDFYQNKM